MRITKKSQMVVGAAVLAASAVVSQAALTYDLSIVASGGTWAVYARNDAASNANVGIFAIAVQVQPSNANVVITSAGTTADIPATASDGNGKHGGFFSGLGGPQVTTLGSGVNIAGQQDKITPGDVLVGVGQVSGGATYEPSGTNMPAWGYTAGLGVEVAHGSYTASGAGGTLTVSNNGTWSVLKSSTITTAGTAPNSYSDWNGLTSTGVTVVPQTSGTLTPAVSTTPLISLVPSNSTLTTSAGTKLIHSNTTFSPDAGNSNDYIVVSGGTTAGYGPGYATPTSPVANGNTEAKFGTVSSFTVGDKEIYALAVNISGGPAGATIANLVSDLSGSNGFGTAANQGSGEAVVASATRPAGLPADFATGSPFSTATGVVYLTATGTTAQDALLGWNFSPAALTADDSANFNGSTVSVAAVAAVPEPATVAAVFVSAAGLLIGRRRRRV